MRTPAIYILTFNFSIIFTDPWSCVPSNVIKDDSTCVKDGLYYSISIKRSQRFRYTLYMLARLARWVGSSNRA